MNNGALKLIGCEEEFDLLGDAFAGDADEALKQVKPERWVAAIQGMSNKTTDYHAVARRVNPEQTTKAAQNMPFLPLVKEMARRRISGQDEVQAADNYLRTEFGHLQTYGVSFSVSEFDLAKEQSVIKETTESLQRSGMVGMTDTINHDHRVFSGLRQMFHEGSLSIDNVVPLECMSALFMAAPVWFFKAVPGFSVTDYFCDQTGWEFSWFFQIYNGQSGRRFEEFSGRDVISPSLAIAIEKASRIFDCLVIATPYHHLPSWTTAVVPNVDPFLVGFSRNSSHMYVLARWSGTGVLPMVCDMVADTMQHLTSNFRRIETINCNGWRNIASGQKPNFEKFIRGLKLAYDNHQMTRFFSGAGMSYIR